MDKKCETCPKRQVCPMANKEMRKKLLSSLTPEMKAKIQRTIWKAMVLDKVFRHKTTMRILSVFLTPFQFLMMLKTWAKAKKMQSMYLRQMDKMLRIMMQAQKMQKKTLGLVNPEKKKTKKAHTENRTPIA